MFGLKTKNTDRAAEIRATLHTAEGDLAEARSTLGNAVADGDESAAANARKEVARLEQLTSELRAALPVAERRAQDAADRETARLRAEQARAANAQRAKRVAAARSVDKALASLGKAFDAYLDTAPGATPEARVLLHRRSGIALRATVLFHAPSFASALGIPRVAISFRRALADSEAGVLPECNEAAGQGTAS
jgi:hypothetical protein